MLVVELGQAWAGYDEGLFLYEQGYYERAVAEWLPLAEQGDAKAQLVLGKSYYLGKGVLQQDDVEARKWFEKSAGKGMQMHKVMLML